MTALSQTSDRKMIIRDDRQRPSFGRDSRDSADDLGKRSIARSAAN
jgi:hypothetical protein